MNLQTNDIGQVIFNNVEINEIRFNNVSVWSAETRLIINPDTFVISSTALSSGSYKLRYEDEKGNVIDGYEDIEVNL